MHDVARELSVRRHYGLISQQVALACHPPQHPCHQLYHRPPDDRSERWRSPIGRFAPDIQQYLVEASLSSTSYKSVISRICEYAVRTAIESSSSKLLFGRPPPNGYSRTDSAKEGSDYAGKIALRSQPNPCLVHEHNRPDSAQPFPRLCSFVSWHPPPFQMPFEANHTDSKIIMDCADRIRVAPQVGDWWDELTKTWSWDRTCLKIIDVIGVFEIQCHSVRK